MHSFRSHSSPLNNRQQVICIPLLKVNSLLLLRHLSQACLMFMALSASYPLKSRSLNDLEWLWRILYTSSSMRSWDIWIENVFINIHNFTHRDYIWLFQSSCIRKRNRDQMLCMMFGYCIVQRLNGGDLSNYILWQVNCLEFYNSLKFWTKFWQIVPSNSSKFPH